MYIHESYKIDIPVDIYKPVVSHVSEHRLHKYLYGDAKASGMMLLKYYSFKSPEGVYAMTSDFCPRYINSFVKPSSHCDLVLPYPVYDDTGKISGETTVTPTMPCQYFTCGLTEIECRDEPLQMLVIIDLFSTEIAVCCLGRNRSSDLMTHGLKMLAEHMKRAAPAGSKALVYTGRNTVFKDKKVQNALASLPDIKTYIPQKASNAATAMVLNFFKRWKVSGIKPHIACTHVWNTVANEILLSIHYWNNHSLNMSHKNINPAVTTRLFSFADAVEKEKRLQDLISSEKKALESKKCPVIEEGRDFKDELALRPFEFLLANAFAVTDEESGRTLNVFVIIDEYSSELLALDWQEKLNADLIIKALKQLYPFREYLPGCRIYTHTALPDPEEPDAHNLLAELQASTDLHEVLRDLGIRLRCSSDYQASGAPKARGIMARIKNYLGLSQKLDQYEFEQLLKVLPDWKGIYNEDGKPSPSTLRTSWFNSQKNLQGSADAGKAPDASADPAASADLASSANPASSAAPAVKPAAGTATDK